MFVRCGARNDGARVPLPRQIDVDGWAGQHPGTESSKKALSMRALSLFVFGCLVSSIAAPSGAQADGCLGDGAPLFHCSFNGGAKTVDICQQAEVVYYRFGPANGAAEQILARDIRGVDMQPWNGVGRAIWEQVTFYNTVYSYIIDYSVERDPSGPPAEGRLIVAEEDSEIAELLCDTGSVSVADFYPLFEAKEAAGQCYDRETFSWMPC